MADRAKQDVEPEEGNEVDAQLARAYLGEAESMFAEIEDLIECQAWPSD